VVETACRRIEQAEEVPSLAALAAHVRLSPQHFHRLFRRIAGITPKAYAAAHRQSRVQRELAAGSRVTDTIYNSGFNSTGRFYAAAGEMLGMKPSQYRRGGAGESIRYTMRRSSIGIVLVAATERGICAILLGDERDALLSELTARFPKAKITLAKREFAAWVRQIVGMLDHPQQVPPALPLDIRGTAFQRRVWQVLRTIPAGQTLSYTEVAERIGQSAAVRAVAGACAANPLAVAIPCHRVRAAGGKLSGYRWGIERKRQLLKRESIVVAE
jgi:AraC family transcriptional regulator of adaptative response/methylated-DNA-[protein]-cysteine methyltransferase